MNLERVRNENELYPDFTSEIDALDEGGITPYLLGKIINKHALNSQFNRALYKRYQALQDEVPIFTRMPRYKPDDDPDGSTIINNKIANDFMGEIVDFKTGYFAGSPIGYSYSNTEESEDDTGGYDAVKAARKALSDFVTANNMFDVDMETTKYASIYGYAGRLFYHQDGVERVMPVHGFETIILSRTSITEPQYGVRYYRTTDINDVEYWKAEFYDDANIYYYEGRTTDALTLIKTERNLYGYCPLQGIPNNNEMIGDAEKVLTLIDAYDRTVSDSSNQIEGEVNSKTVYKNLNIDDDEIQKSNYTGAIKVMDPMGNGDVFRLNNSVNDSYTEHHLERLKNNIYRFSKTPNLSDETFGTASGISLKFKITGLETKCGMFEAKMISAGVYMFKLLAKCYNARGISFDPLQCVMEFKRNFPLDLLSEAQSAQALINAGLPEEVAYSAALSCIDDIDWVMQLKEKEQNSIPSLERAVKEDYEDEETDETEEPEDINTAREF